MVSSPPVISLLLRAALRSSAKKVCTSGWATIASRCSLGRASKARTFMGRERMLMVFMVKSFLSSFFSALGSALGGSFSAFSKSSSRPLISADSFSFSALWASCSSVNLFMASSTACCSSSVVASPIAFSISAERVANSASLATSASKAALFSSSFLAIIMDFSAMSALLS